MKEPKEMVETVQNNTKQHQKTVTEVKKAFDQLTSRLDIDEERISELEDI